MKKIFCIATVYILTVGIAQANTWDGDSGTNDYWATGANWVEGGAPGFGGTAVFTGTAASTIQPDLNGTSRTGNGLDFQTAGWTVNDTVGGAGVRIDGGLSLSSQGAGLNTLHANVTGSGGSPLINIGSGNTMLITGSFNASLQDVSGSGVLILGGDLTTSSPRVEHASDVSIIFNSNQYIYHAQVGGNATIGGTGVVRGFSYQNTTFSDSAKLAPGSAGGVGNEIGTLTWGSQHATNRHELVMNTGTSFEVQFGTSGEADKLVYDSYGGGNITLQSGVTLNLYGTTIQDGTYTIMENLLTDMEDISGTFSTVNYNGSAIDPGNFTVNYNGDSITIDVVAIPEPSTIILMVSGLIGMIFFRRKA